MKWIKLSNRYLNLAHVASVFALPTGDDGVTTCNVLANHEWFTLRGADAEALLIALEEECK